MVHALGFEEASYSTVWWSEVKLTVESFPGTDVFEVRAASRYASTVFEVQVSSYFIVGSKSRVSSFTFLVL